MLDQTSQRNFDIKKKELNDVSPNHDQPIKLRYDTVIFNKLVKNCKVVD